MTDLTTVEVLRAARALIEDQSRWTTGVLRCDLTGRMCALGAISNALGLPSHQYPDDDHPAVVALGTVAREVLVKDSPGYLDDEYEPVLSECVVDLNDGRASAEHHAKVIAMFDAAISATEQA